MNTLINKFCNLLMRSGNKTKALKLFSQSFNLFLTNKDLAPLSIESNNNKTNIIISPNHRPINFNSKLIITDNKTLSYILPNLLPTDSRALSLNKFSSPESILETIIENVRPCLEIRKVRIARATYQVPAQLSKSKGQTLALRWIIESAGKRKQREKMSFVESLAQELSGAYRKQGIPRQRRNDLHKLAETNRSSMRYRWW